jgi:hypothetical protein
VTRSSRTRGSAGRTTSSFGARTGAGALVEDVRDGRGADGAARERVLEGGLDLGLVVPVEELQQAGDLSAEMLAAERQRLDEPVGARAGGRRRSRPRSSWARRFSRASSSMWAGSSMTCFSSW